MSADEPRQIFLSHADADADVARQLADGLEQAGYPTWCRERDAGSGPPDPLRTAHAVEGAAAVVLLISPDSLRSRDVTAEVVRAHESARPFLPVLLGVSYAELAARQPEWREALGAATSISLPPGGIDAVVLRLCQGLQVLGIAPTTGHAPRLGQPRTSPLATPAPRGPRGRGRVALALLGVVALIAIGMALAGGGGTKGSSGTRGTTGTSGTTTTRPSAEPTTALRAINGCVITQGAVCPGVDLRSADLRGADLRSANLEGALLDSALLAGADLSDADLSKASLDGADLTGADLSGATVTEAVLARSNLTGARVDTVRFDKPPFLWDARGIDAGVLAGIFDMAPADLARYIAQNDIYIDATLPQAMAAACSATPVPDAGAALAGTAFRPLVTVVVPTAGITADQYEHPVPEGLRAAVLGYARLVVCVDEDTFPEVGTCGPYVPEDGGDEFMVTVHSEQVRLRVVDPATGATVAARDFDAGLDLGECPMVVFRGGSEDRTVDTGTINDWLTPFAEGAT